MKSISIVKIDAEGRVILPASIRDDLLLNGDDKLAIDRLSDGTLAVKKMNSKMKFDKWLNDDLSH